MMRWGMPPPPRAGGYPVTNIRNTTSSHWRTWLRPENRCLVLANSFAEYAPEPNPGDEKEGPGLLLSRSEPAAPPQPYSGSFGEERWVSCSVELP